MIDPAVSELEIIALRFEPFPKLYVLQLKWNKKAP